MPEAIYLLLFLCAVLFNCLMYAWQLSLLQLLIWALSLLQLLIWASYRYFYLDRLPEAIYCCLQTYNVYDVLLIMYYMCIPVFLSLVLKGSYECILLIYVLPKAICCCLETCNVYVVLLTIIMCTNFHGHHC